MKVVKAFLVALCRTILASAFWLSIRLSTSLTVHGIEHDPCLPRTYLGMTHKRDIDPFILIPSIIFRHGWKEFTGGVRFALRGDGFTRGFLARVTSHVPWVAWALRPLSVGPALRWLGAYPTDGLIRPAEEWVREALALKGHVQADTLLTSTFLQTLAQAAHLPVETVGQQPLARLLAWKYHTALYKFTGPEILLATERREIERQVIARIRPQLEEITAYLWQGGSILGSPEGQLSPEGHLSPLHAGFWRMLRVSPPDLRILPIATIYDFMTTRRPRIFVDFAPVIEHAPRLTHEELQTRLRRAWLLRTHFTCTQLASGFLMERRYSPLREFTFDELTHAVHQHARSLADAGRHVDPQLLRLAGAARRVRGYLAYVERRGLVRRGTSGKWTITFDELVMEVALREVAYDDVPLLYAYHELQDLLSVE
jgi:hypothetical protein